MGEADGGGDDGLLDAGEHGHWEEEAGCKYVVHCRIRLYL